MKIGFFCGPDDKFLNPIIERFSKQYECRKLASPYLQQDILNLYIWCDVAWFEWCNLGVVWVTQNLPKRCKIIVRLHSYEAFEQSPALVDWQKVDDLIFVAPHIRDIVLSKYPAIKGNTTIHLIKNGVDLSKFTYREHNCGYNIAYVGYINYKKNPGLLLYCMKYLIDVDSRYMLHIAGVHQDKRIELYMDHLIMEMGIQDNIRFHGWQEDINAWLQDKDYVINTSYLESFCYGIAEGMACGIKPVIHNWVGAEQVYPRKYLFNDVHQFYWIVGADSYNSAEYRKFIEDNYLQEKQMAAIANIFETAVWDVAPKV